MYTTKAGKLNVAVGRTGIIEGDLVTINFPSDQFNLLLSVSRSGEEEQRMLFEFPNDDKKIIYGYPCNKAGAKELMSLICQITGLQAKLFRELSGGIIYEMQKGQNIFAQ
ncbi:MAG: hypothetical protein PHE20_03795 [Patescibacteria group bacterium]|nr:hypothetical protein [Patescibacteria group bacterium]